MKNRCKNTAFFAQVMVLCLCLAACGNSDDVAGGGLGPTRVGGGRGNPTPDRGRVGGLGAMSARGAALYPDRPGPGVVDRGCLPLDILPAG